MTTRETTLGALTAADLGKRVEVGGYIGTLAGIAPSLDDYKRVHFTFGGFDAFEPDTPVTVYDEEEA